jgi:hypothetical protein
MRNKLVLCLILLVSLAWAAAQQQSPTSPGAPGSGMPPAQSTAPSEPGQATPPSSPAPGAGQMPAAGEPDVIEGCLGGSAPNFTVTDNSGKAYKLDIPAGADASVLTKHVGESVQVMGAVSGSGAAGSSVGSSATDKGKGGTITVQKIGRGKGTCSGAATGQKPPAQ